MVEMTHPACKICAAPTEIQGCVDAGRSCEIAKRIYLPLIGKAIWYLRCGECGFIFTQDFDDWSKADFRRYIYNDEYHLADPGWIDGIREGENAKTTAIVMGQYQAKNVLDYGGGHGGMARMLRDRGIEAETYDPLFSPTRPSSKFDLVTAFEVFEHSPRPLATLEEAIGMAGPTAPLLFTTMLHDNVPPQDVSSWYIAPRNGHVSIWTRKSLSIAFNRFGWKVVALNGGTHLATRIVK